MSANPPAAGIRVLIVDDHTLVRDGIARQLEASGGIEVVGGCGSVREALDLAAEHQPDVVLLDYDLGGENGVAYLTAAAKLDLRIPVLILTGWVSDAEYRRLVNLGVMGVVSKKETSAALARAVGSIARGEPWFDQEEVLAMVLGRAEEPLDPVSAELSVRERAAIRCLLQGLANKEISHELGVSESAVKAILQRLFERAGVRTRAQLVRVALERGWG